VGAGVGDCSGGGLERCEATSESVNTSKRRAYLAKAMVRAIKTTVKAINQAFIIANLRESFSNMAVHFKPKTAT
jgi:hypothetical protein